MDELVAGWFIVCTLFFGVAWMYSVYKDWTK